VKRTTPVEADLVVATGDGDRRRAGVDRAAGRRAHRRRAAPAAALAPPLSGTP
jgi:hypothetical protein